MECNKEEAEKCKAISEASLRKLDLAAARRFALKARQLFPELDGLAQLSSILDVSVAAHQKLQNGESNWYAILQIDFRADENTIRKQYRKLALFLHPDKNKAFGAEAAFKHISEAWSVLSDGKKKKDYDKRWFAHMASQRARSPHNSPPFQARENMNKQPMNGMRQSQQHMHQEQMHRQGQSHVHHQQERQGQGHAKQPQRHAHGPAGKVHAKQQGPSPVHVHQQQGKGEMHAHQQHTQWQATDHANQQQRQGEASIQQQGKVHPYQGQDGVQTHVQGQVPESARQQQRQSHLHADLQQFQGQTPPHQQEGQGQAHAHHQQQQGIQKQRLNQAYTEQPGQGDVRARWQQEQGPVQGQDQVNARQQQQQGQADALQRGKVYVEQQGQSNDHRQQEEGKAHAYHQQGKAKMHVQQQEQDERHIPAQRHFPEQGQGHECGQQQQDVHQKHEEQHDACHAEDKQAHFSKFSFAQDKSAFWTACPYCKMQLEYERAYINKNLCCPMCYRPFVSKEIEPVQGNILWLRPMKQHSEASEKDASNKACTVDEPDCIPQVDSSVPKIVHCDKKANRDEMDTSSQDKFHITTDGSVCAEKGTVKQKQEQKGKAGIRKTSGVHRIPARMKEVINQECPKERGNPTASASINRSYAEGNVSAAMPFVQNIAAASEQTARISNMEEKPNNSIEFDSRVRPLNLAGPKKNGTAAVKAPASRSLNEENIPAPNLKEKANDADECISRVTRNSAKTNEIGGTAGSKEIGGSQNGPCLSKQGSSKMELSQHKRKLASSTIMEDLNTVKRLRRISNQSRKSVDDSESHQLLKDCNSSGKSSLQVYAADGTSDECEMEVPDADFYDFDKDRTERHFAVGQIWATYDDDDGMPRYYARVNKILSIEPFKLQMNWLEARNPTCETLAWLEAGFQHSCGDFKLGSMYIADQVSTFSHLMMVDKIPKGGYIIYPRQGDVWAVYKDWEFVKVRDDHHGYEMVEIMETYDEKRGVRVAPLFKVAGFKTIFERKAGEEYIKWFPLHELRRFSHQVPASPVVAGKAPGIQVDCLEIDPASTPMNLIIGEQ